MSVKQLVNKLINREVDLKDFINEYILKIENDNTNSIISFDKQLVTSRVEELQKKLDNKEPLGKLFGIPIIVKDNINVLGYKTTCGSKMLENYEAIYNATVTEKLLKEDAVLIAKSNMDEFAMGSSNETSYFGKVLNPLDNTRIPGGSSGGSAASVAAGLAPLALGSDTGGSIRQPAAMCGVVGFKPTYGRVSRYGLVAFASSLDQIGPFSDSVKDSAYLMEIISGYDKKDSTSVDIAVDNYSDFDSVDVKSMKVGIPKEFFGEGLSDDVKKNIEERIEILKSNGVDVVDITLPHTDYAVAVYYILATAEASANLSRYDGVRYGYRAKDVDNLIDMYEKTRSEGFGDEVKRRIMLGTYVLSSGYYDAYFKKGQQVRTLIKQDFLNAFKDVDVILTPVTPTLPFKLGEKTDDPLQMYLSDIYTISANLAGVPALAVRAGKIGELSVGVQLIGKDFDEKRLLAFGDFLDKKE